MRIRFLPSGVRCSGLRLGLLAGGVLLLSGCGVATGVASGAASVAGTAVDVAGTVVGTSVDIITAPIR